MQIWERTAQKMIQISIVVLVCIALIPSVINIALICAIFKISKNSEKLTEIEKQNKELIRLLDINNSLTAREINEITAKRK